VGNGLDPQPPGNPPINDGPGTAPGSPGLQGGGGSAPGGGGGGTDDKGNNGVGNGLDPQPPGDPAVNDGDGTAPGSPGLGPDTLGLESLVYDPLSGSFASTVTAPAPTPSPAPVPAQPVTTQAPKAAAKK
jgi:hypothetical protein